MWFYISLLCAVLFFSYFVSFSQKAKSIKLAKFITFNLLFIPAAIRYGIGIDFPTYIKMFDSVAEGINTYTNIKMDLGWYWLNRIVYLIGGSGQIVIAIAAFLSIYFIFSEIDNKDWVLFAPIFILVFYTWVFTTVRQMLVVCMFFYAFKKYQKGYLKQAIIILILSFFIHKSAIFYLPILFIANKLNFDHKSSIIYFLICFAFCFLVFPKLVNASMSLLEKTPYYYYAYSSHAEQVSSASTNSGFGRIIRYFAYLLIIVFFPKSSKHRLILNLFILYTTFDFLSQSIILISRLARCLIFVFLPIAWIAWNEKDSFRQIRIATYTGCYIILFLLELYGGFHGSIPYKTIFQ